MLSLWCVQRGLFSSVSIKGGKTNKKKVAVWSHDFFCLADTEQVKTPSPYDRSLLQAAGKIISYFVNGLCRGVGG